MTVVILVLIFIDTYTYTRIYIYIYIYIYINHYVVMLAKTSLYLSTFVLSSNASSRSSRLHPMSE